MNGYSVDQQMTRELQQKFDNMSFFDEDFQPQVQQLDERRRQQMRRAPVFVPSEGTNRKIVKDHHLVQKLGRTAAANWVKQLERSIEAFDQRIAVFADVTAAEHDRNVENERRRDQLLAYIADIDKTS